MKVPVKVDVDSETKKFTVEVGIPPTVPLSISKEANITKGSGTAGTNYAGNLAMVNAVKIAKMKIEKPYFICYKYKSEIKEVIGTCMSIGVTIEEKFAKDIYSDITSGKYDELFQLICFSRNSKVNLQTARYLSNKYTTIFTLYLENT